MKDALRAMVLAVCKLLGLFALARALTRQDLRILCYHGATLHDEHLFRPGVFMTAQTFAARMALLARKGYPVLELGPALEAMDAGTLPDHATVITIDDGWHGTYAKHAPILASHRFASTLYLSSYYFTHQGPVHRVAYGYVMWSAWRRGRTTLNLNEVDPRLTGVHALDSPADSYRAVIAMARLGDRLDSNAARDALLDRLCAVTGEDATQIRNNRALGYLTPTEARELERQGMDMQLHTHRHIYPVNDELALIREIDDNREALRHAVSDRPRTHLCYPSGVFSRACFPTLEKLGISSATTTVRGFCRRGMSRLELPRIADSETTWAITFEAEMAGFLECCRRVRARLRRDPPIGNLRRK
jgi:peptidoglycan/xylan/chitin deacetylase (PgdA/CDA1 family)